MLWSSRQIDTNSTSERQRHPPTPASFFSRFWMVIVASTGLLTVSGACFQSSSGGDSTVSWQEPLVEQQRVLSTLSGSSCRQGGRVAECPHLNSAIGQLSAGRQSVLISTLPWEQLLAGWKSALLSTLSASSLEISWPSGGYQ